MQTDPHTHQALSVSELNREAKNLLERHFDWVWVEGEISQFTAASSGHWYFSLKDTGAQVRCAMFRRANGRAKLQPKTGDSVRIRARVTLYEFLHRLTDRQLRDIGLDRFNINRL